jgi:hypothetical protein
MMIGALPNLAEHARLLRAACAPQRPAARARAGSGARCLPLDTESSAAERLYIRLGWTKYGEIPAYATSPDGRSRDPVSFFYKMLWPRA